MQRLRDFWAMVCDGYEALQKKPWTLFLGCFSLGFFFMSEGTLLGDLLLHQTGALLGDLVAKLINAFCTVIWMKDW